MELSPHPNGHRPTALVLDFGGVLTSDIWESAREFARERGIQPEAMVDLFRRNSHVVAAFADLERGDIDQAAFCERFASEVGLPAQGLLGGMLGALRPNERMLAAARALGRSGIRIGLLSNSSGAGPFDPYAGYDLHEWTDTMVISHEVRTRKPEEDIYSILLDRLGVSGEECLFVDDVEANLVPAARLGMRVIHHRDTGATIDELESVFGCAPWR